MNQNRGNHFNLYFSDDLQAKLDRYLSQNKLANKTNVVRVALEEFLDRELSKAEQ